MYPLLRCLNWSEIATWEDLEKGIVALPTEQERGEVFEEFCQVYFTLQSDLYQIQKVWRWVQVPLSIIKSLGCSSQDEGIDGVIVHHDGTITAYQAKFRSSRSNLPSQHELSTFYMVSDRADYRLVISNVEDLPRIARERKDHGQILIDILLQLEQEFFTCLKDYIQTEEVRQEPPPTPKPFQIEAINSIAEGLELHSRGQAILACGAGKTLIGKWVVDRLNARWVLVLCPSLALVRQTLEEWHRARAEAFHYICICSDETVNLRGGRDEWELMPAELDVKVSTTPADLVAFLQRTDLKTHVVFSTYQSSPVIVEALKDQRLTNFRFDLTLCDEAHRLAGVTGRLFSQILHEKLIRSQKRLFMTATPKIISPRLGAKHTEESPAIHSMNNPNIFGPVLYSFPFGQAIKEKVICDYRVIVIGVTEEEITKLVRAGGSVQTEDSETWQAESLAQRIALGKAVANYGLKKVFTFHNRVQSAAQFVDSRFPDSFPAVLNRMKPDLKYVALHINGEMSTAVRSRILREFRMSPRGVVSNARCLGEGVNVPVVDGVFFADPRESVIDIVQATGRALRRVPGKEYAYLIIPVLVGEEEDAEEILENSKFHTVWKVLSAMVSQDDRLEAIIRDARIRQGEGKLSVLGAEAGSHSHDPIDCHTVLMGFPTHIPFSKYQGLLTLEVMEKIGERWHLRFGALKKYMECHGEEPPQNAEYEGFKIGKWLQAQRNAYKKGNLPNDKSELLDDLGIRWGVFPDNERNWVKHMMACSNYYESTGKLPTSGDESSEGLKVGHWLCHQRRLHKKGSLPQDRIKTIERLLGQIWNPAQERWETNYSAYKDYVEKTGKQPERRTVHNGINIGNWLINTVRPNKQKLSTEQVQRLDALGFNWERRSRKKRIIENKIGKWLQAQPLDKASNQPPVYVWKDSSGMGWAIKKDGAGKMDDHLPEDSEGMEAHSSAELAYWFEFYERYRKLLIESPDEMSRAANKMWKGRDLVEWFEEQVRLVREGRLPRNKALLIDRLSNFQSQLDGKRRKAETDSD